MRRPGSDNRVYGSADALGEPLVKHRFYIVFGYTLQIKFAIVIDLSIDYDYEEPTETLVYFLDEITEEVLDYAGLKLTNADAT